MKTKSNRIVSRKSKLLKIAKKWARPVGALLLAAAVLMPGAQSASAYEYFWNATTGQWENGENWHIGSQGGEPATAPPTATDDVYIDNGGTAIIDATTGDAYRLYVGYSGTGTLKLTDGGKATSASRIYIGLESGSSGTVTVDGKDSELNCGSYLSVGDYGTGTLNLTNGGKATVVSEFGIGAWTNSSGTVNVGNGSELNVDHDLYVGNFGTGTLNLTDGGKAASANRIYIGSLGGSSGTVMVGKGSTLETASNVYVGNSGTGVLAGTGTVTVGGTDSVLVNSKGTLSAGDNPGDIDELKITGKLELLNNATIHVDFNNDGSAAVTNHDLIAVTGDVTLGDTLNISLSSLTDTIAGTRTIVSATETMTAAALTGKLTFNGLDLAGSRADGTVTLDVTGGNLQITAMTLAGDATNKFVTWNTGDGVWDITTKNWYEDTVPGTPIQFLDGDAVTFANTTATVINIQGTQKFVAQMLITGSGDLTINGNILGDYRQSTFSSGELTYPTALSKLHRQLEQFFQQGNYFLRGEGGG